MLLSRPIDSITLRRHRNRWKTVLAYGTLTLPEIGGVAPVDEAAIKANQNAKLARLSRKLLMRDP
jgi:hypothetical protein